MHELRLHHDLGERVSEVVRDNAEHLVSRLDRVTEGSFHLDSLDEVGSSTSEEIEQPKRLLRDSMRRLPVRRDRPDERSRAADERRRLNRVNASLELNVEGFRADEDWALRDILHDHPLP